MGLIRLLVSVLALFIELFVVNGCCNWSNFE